MSSTLIEPEASVEGFSPKPAKAAKAVAADAPPKRVTIILEENENIPPTGLFLGINGRPYLIVPGENVDVPPEVIAALDDAVEAVPKTDQQGNVISYRNKLRFPYRVIGR